MMNNLEIKNCSTKFKKSFLQPKYRFPFLFSLFLLLSFLAVGWLLFINIFNIFQDIAFPISEQNIKISLVIFIAFIFVNFFLLLFLKKENQILLTLLLLVFFISLVSTIILGIVISKVIAFLLNLTNNSLMKEIFIFVIYIILIFVTLLIIDILLIINFVSSVRNKNDFISNLEVV